MRKGLSLVGLSLVVLVAFSPVPVSRAEGAVRVLQNRASFRFSQNLSFSLVAESDQEIKDVALYYRRRSERVTSRVAPQFTPGRHVEATFKKDLEPGEIPPGTTFEYYWRLSLADGTQSDTPTQTLLYDDDRFAWQTLQAGNLTLLYYGEGQAPLAQQLAQAAQAALARMQSQVGVTLNSPVRIYIYQNSNDMRGALAARSEGFDERVVTLGVAVSDNTLLLLGSHTGVEQTIAHELSHIVVGLATKNPYSPVPRWLDEGLAMYAEGSLPAENLRAFNDAVAHDRLISVRSLSGYTGDASQVDLYYGEVYSLVDFMLRTFGRDKMAELLKVFKEGTYPDDALRQVYGLSLDGLDAAWRTSLGLKPRTTATAAGPAPTVPKAGTAAPRDSGGGALCPATGFLGALGLLLAVGLRRPARSA
jgi:hypothetical protein